MTVQRSRKMNEEMPHFSQKTGPYKDVPYHANTIGTDGCGPVAFAMAASWLLGRRVEPPEITEWIGRRFAGRGGKGTRPDFFFFVTRHYGLKMQATNDTARAVKAVSRGLPVIYYTPGTEDGLFSVIPHYLVLSGIDEKGRIYIHNPNDRSDGKAFEPEVIEKYKAKKLLKPAYIILAKK